MLRSRVPLLVLTAVGAVIALAGCSAHDSTGLVSVAVPQDAGEHPYEVEVVIDATHQLAEHQRVYPGGSADFAGVPLGRVTVRGGDLCPRHATVANGDAVHVTLVPPPCTS